VYWINLTLDREHNDILVLAMILRKSCLVHLSTVLGGVLGEEYPQEFLIVAANGGEPHVPSAITPGKEQLYTLDRRLDGP
jgi:hypothetical protein